MKIKNTVENFWKLKQTFHEFIPENTWERISKAKEPDVVRLKRYVVRKLVDMGYSYGIIAEVMSCHPSAISYLHKGKT